MVIKILLVIFTFFLFLSCDNQKENELLEKKLKLSNNISDTKIVITPSQQQKLDDLKSAIEIEKKEIEHNYFNKNLNPDTLDLKSPKKNSLNDEIKNKDLDELLEDKNFIKKLEQNKNE